MNLFLFEAVNLLINVRMFRLFKINIKRRIILFIRLFIFISNSCYRVLLEPPEERLELRSAEVPVALDRETEDELLVLEEFDRCIVGALDLVLVFSVL